MRKKIYKATKILSLLESDACYQELEQQRQKSLAAFRKVMEMLEEEQRDAIIEYIGIAEEQHWRVVEMLCEES